MPSPPWKRGKTFRLEIPDGNTIPRLLFKVPFAIGHSVSQQAFVYAALLSREESDDSPTAIMATSFDSPMRSIVMAIATGVADRSGHQHARCPG